MTNTVSEVGVEQGLGRSRLSVTALRDAHSAHALPNVRLKGGVLRGLVSAPPFRDTYVAYTLPKVGVE